jgi:Ser/Thr protein kinase RdoA (MazF antagonist)
VTSPPAEGLGYSALSPDVVLDLLDAVGLRGDGRVLQLNSFENRVFQVYLEDGGAVVAKFYRPGRWSDAQIVEEHAFAHELAAAEVPVAAPLALERGGGVELAGEPPTLALAANGHRFAATRCHAGRSPELDSGETLHWIGRFIGRIHAVGARRRFEQRATLSAAVGDAARETILRSGLLPEAPEAAWTAACDAALDEARRRIEAVAADTLRLHGDCHRGNLLWSASGPHFVDLDDACNGPAMQDLWMLLDGDRATARQQLEALVAGYRQVRDFDRRETALIEPLRTLRLLQHSAWIARRWHDPAFPRAFPGFGGAAYWQQQTADLRDQLGAMAEDPL